jgi:hypothetical protein
LKIKCVDSRVKVFILASTSVLLTLTTVKVPNLAVTHTKLITVYKYVYHLQYKDTFCTVYTNVYAT